MPCHVGMWGEGEEKRYAVFYLCTPENLDVELSIEHDTYEWMGFENIEELENTKPHLKRALKEAKKLLPFIETQ